MPFEKISADEAHSLRKDVTNDMGVMAKGVPVSPEVVKAAKFDDAKREARFVMSAEIPDRMGDVVVQEGLDTTNFDANPQALLFHNSRNWPIGTWKDVTKTLTGRPKRTEGTMKLLPIGEDEDADRAARHIKHGTMRTVSIGFRPKWDDVEAIRDAEGRMTGLRFNASELLECSLVPIPALPAAAMKELKTGMLSPESLELIKGILEQFELKDGEVLNRDELEGAVREAEGNKTYHIIEHMKAGETLTKKADGTIEVRSADGLPVGGTVKADGDDGEGVPIAPNPADGEKVKELAAQADSVAMFERHTALIKEAARGSKEPGLFARLLNAFSAKDEPATPIVDPVMEIQNEAPALSAEAKAALLARVDKSIQSATAKVVEPDPV